MLVPANKPLIAVIAAASPIYWRHWRQKDDVGATAAYPTPAAAIAAGETVDWTGPDGARVGPTAAEARDFMLLVRRPEGCNSGTFVLKLAGQWYAPVRFTAEKTIWPDIRPGVSSLQLRDSGERNVPLEEGRLDGYFVKLWTIVGKGRNGNNKTQMRIGLLEDASGNSAKVPEKFSADLAGIAAMLSPASAAAAGPSEEIDA